VRNWAAKLNERLARGEACVLVTVALAKGSTPREAGARMIVSATAREGSVGGGRLEYLALARARELLQSGEGPAVVDFSLGPELGQCCGGFTRLFFERLLPRDGDWLAPLANAPDESAVIVTGADGAAGLKAVVRLGDEAPGDLPPAVRAAALALLAETGASSLLELPEAGARYLLDPFSPSGRPLWLFGAGHVGRALVHVLAELPFNVHWVDERRAEFPETVPENVTVHASARPVRAVDEAPPGSLFLVMTHAHQLDFELCARILERGDFAYLGLIGSKSKRQRFLRGLRELGLAESALSRLVCPIGIGGIAGKSPGEIAVATAAQLLQLEAAQDRAAVPAKESRWAR